ncbi:HS3SA-like protein [Mya arenaria]|uniref:HS3SA-like protein n=1 Tax=Mya arenaria TaxID=6604 RepID=A0ABY7GAU8_MYAAR|nr:HS3SA-like protein [Mya arenaria]
MFPILVTEVMRQNLSTVVGEDSSPVVGKYIVGQKKEQEETELLKLEIDNKVRKELTERGLNKIRDLGRFDLLEQRECKKRLPEALIIGIMKGGTEAFSIFLALNTKVAMSLNTATTMFFTSNYHRGPSWYRDQMMCSTGDQITIEKAPQYMPSASAPLRVYRMNPDMKLIVLVRDPIARAVSHYLQVRIAAPKLA